MLVIDDHLLAVASQALCLAARRATDEQGLMVHVKLPSLPQTKAQATSGDLYDPTDHNRINAIALAAIVSLTGHPCRVSGEIPLSLSNLNAKATK